MTSIRHLARLLFWGAVIVVCGCGCSKSGLMNQPVKVVFLAGEKSHGPGDHEYEKGLRLFQSCLERMPEAGNIKTELYTNGWPEDAATLNDADTIVLFSDGSDGELTRHPFLVDDRMQCIAKQMRRGCGLVVIHYSIIVPSQTAGPQFLDWVGGYFDYENGTGPKNWYSKIQFARTMTQLPSPDHPIARGLAPFELEEEYYYNIRFLPDDPRVTAILATPIPGEPDMQTVAWAVQRADGGRGFAFTGGHFHSNWQLDDLRRMMLNAILWTAKAEVPSGGVESILPDSQS